MLYFEFSIERFYFIGSDVASEFINEQHLNQFCFYLRYNYHLMKLVIKYNEILKLYTEDLSYNVLIDFIEKEFNLKRSELSISFIDQEGDEITILTNQDLTTMQFLLSEKEYVKINLTLTKESQSTSEAPINDSPQGQTFKISQNLKIQETHQIEQLEPQKCQQNYQLRNDEGFRKQDWKGKCRKNEWRGKCHRERRHKSRKSEENANVPKQSEEQRHNDWKKGRCQMKRHWQETVAKLVDQRVKALLPCIREQIMQKREKVESLSNLVHQNIQCKGCCANPIRGIRYQCLTCPQFNLCQNCENFIDHHHNLLKVKHLVPVEDQSSSESPFKFFKKFWGHHGRRHSHSSSHEKGRSCKRFEHWNRKKSFKLSWMYGGEPKDYLPFIEANKELKGRQLLRKYAEINGISQSDFNEKLINMKCIKLSNSFGKPIESYRQFVKKNNELNFGKLIHLLFAEGIQKKQDKKSCWGKEKFKFNQSPQKIQNNSNHIAILKAEEPRQMSKLSEGVNAVIGKKDSKQMMREKGAILIQMKQIFGEKDSKEYFKFIDENFQKGGEAIMAMWIEKQTKVEMIDRH